MTGLVAWIRRHPFPAYVILTYTVSWVGWLPFLLSLNGEALLPFRFPEPLGPGSAELVGLLPGAYLGPLSSAFVITAITQGRAGLRVWRARLFRWRVSWGWYLFALVGVPGLLFVGTLAIPGALHGLHAVSVGVLVGYLPALVLQMLTTGIAEEPGWRDFALPRLQARHGALRGTLILGPVWVGWHIPLFFTDWANGVGGGSLWTFALFFVVGMLQSITITWVFNHTRESLPVAMLIHTSNNNFLSVIWPVVFPALALSQVLIASIVGYGVLAAVLVTVTRGRLGRSVAAEALGEGRVVLPPEG